jgi:hypothetical protein
MAACDMGKWDGIMQEDRCTEVLLSFTMTINKQVNRQVIVSSMCMNQLVCQ